MKLYFLTLSLCFVLLLSLQGCYYDNEEYLYQHTNAEITCDTTTVSFSAIVFPILDNQCLSCHSGSTPSGNINLEFYEKIEPYATNGRLWGAISHQPGYSAMPQGGNQLPDCQLRQIKAWIDQGILNN